MRVLSRPAPVLLFAAAALAPALLIVSGATGGRALLIWAALLWLGLLAPLIDTLAAAALPDPQDDAAPGADAVSLLLAGAHLAVLAATLAALSAGTLALAERVALFLAAGLFLGQVSNANAHELIHRGDRRLFWSGALVYVTLLFGHHVSAHRLVHHRHVATAHDPNSARLGESFWRFAPRAWVGSFRAGLRAERRVGKFGRYVIWVGGGLACLAAAAGIGGPRMAADYLALCAYAQMQLLLSDYVQHYGLRRATGPEGRPVPVGPAHSWDAPHLLSSLTLLNAPRHSDHHAHPARPWPALRLNRGAPARPMLPAPLPAMASLALIPPLWRRVMDPRVARMAARERM